MTITTQQVVTMLVGTIAPLLVGLITKTSTSSAVKGILLVTVSALVGIGSSFLDVQPGETWNWQEAVFLAISAWITGVATHFGLWKPTGVAAAAQKTLVRDDVSLAA